MPGASDYTAENVLQYITGNRAPPALPSVFLALFTTAPTSDAGTGGTECSTSGTGYARQQIAGTLALSASFTTGSTTLTLASTAPAWLLALGVNGSGVNAYDATNSQQIGTVSSISGTTVTLTSTAAHASSGSTDNIVFSAFPAAVASSGTQPAITPASSTSGASVNFPAATGAGFGTAVAFGLYDAVTAGNLLGWDYLGNFGYIPCSVSSASPGVFTSHAHGYNVGDNVVVSTKYGGTLPGFSASNFTGLLAIAHAATDTFDVTNASTPVNTNTTGDVQVRKVASQSIPAGVTASFAAGQLVVNAA